MRSLIANLIFLAGVVATLYIGGYLMLYSGIVAIIDGASAAPVSIGLIVWGLIQALILSIILGGIVFLLASATAILVGKDNALLRRGFVAWQQRADRRRLASRR